MKFRSPVVADPAAQLNFEQLQGLLPATAAAESAVPGSEVLQTVTSTTFVDLTGYSLTMTTRGGPVLLMARVRCGAAPTSGVGVLTFGVDGSLDAPGTDGLAIVEVSGGHVPLFWLATLAAGSHAFKVQARVTAGSLFVTTGRRERIIGVELG